MSPPQRPLPTPTSDSRPYWEGCRRHELLLPRCRACRSYFFYPRLLCPRCMSRDLEWVKSSGRGKVYSFSVVHTRFFGQPWEVPYTVAIIQLEEGVRLLSNIVECRPEEVAIGMTVEVTFEDVTEEISLPKFRPSDNLATKMSMPVATGTTKHENGGASGRRRPGACPPGRIPHAGDKPPRYGLDSGAAAPFSREIPQALQCPHPNPLPKGEGVFPSPPGRGSG